MKKRSYLAPNSALTLMVALFEDRESDERALKHANRLLDLAQGDVQLAVRAASMIMEAKTYLPDQVAISRARENIQPALF